MTQPGLSRGRAGGGILLLRDSLRVQNTLDLAFVAAPGVTSGAEVVWIHPIHLLLCRLPSLVASTVLPTSIFLFCNTQEADGSHIHLAYSSSILIVRDKYWQALKSYDEYISAFKWRII